MRRSLGFLLALPGCYFGGETGPCEDSDADACVSSGITIDVLNQYADLDPDTEVILARGGTVDLFVDDGGAPADDLVFDITGGELVSLAPRNLTVRALDEDVWVDVEVGGRSENKRIASRPADDVQLMPVEDQFRYGAPPEEFALVRGAFLSVVIHLYGGDVRLIDGSLRSTGVAVGAEALGDIIVVNGTSDPATLTVSGGEYQEEIQIPLVDPAEVDSIWVADRPGYDNPEQPIVLGEDREARVCFTALAGGIPVAGLEWWIFGDAIEGHGPCATILEGATTMTVETADLSRVLELQIEDP